MGQQTGHGESLQKFFSAIEQSAHRTLVGLPRCFSHREDAYALSKGALGQALRLEIANATPGPQAGLCLGRSGPRAPRT
jgi:hypothetical protein